ncbi:hypothetical protein [Nonomuraea dietziae]|uniref:Uncharacterized protein n=1 Tax=Nonomuraea dietziae TaxID=65515 RepID=A0A7W5UYD1_9ACTN|nr:hypothetical protein [Nonomuraea dietziae]MBB3726946.1 hypothetical protein [Nonomuraea dietziae]
MFTDDLMTEATTRNVRGRPLVRHYVLSGDLTRLEISDTVSMRQWRSSREGSDLYETVGLLENVHRELSVPDRMAAVRLGRERRTPSDLAL